MLGKRSSKGGIRLRDGEIYLGVDGHHYRYHKGLEKGDVYIGSDGHQHHYHGVAPAARQDHHADTDNKSYSSMRHRKKRQSKMLTQLLFSVLCVLAIIIMAYLIFIYAAE